MKYVCLSLCASLSVCSNIHFRNALNCCCCCCCCCCCLIYYSLPAHIRLWLIKMGDREEERKGGRNLGWGKNIEKKRGSYERRKGKRIERCIRISDNSHYLTYYPCRYTIRNILLIPPKSLFPSFWKDMIWHRMYFHGYGKSSMKEFLRW